MDAMYALVLILELTLRVPLLDGVSSSLLALPVDLQVEESVQNID